MDHPVYTTPKYTQANESCGVIITQVTARKTRAYLLALSTFSRLREQIALLKTRTFTHEQ